MGQVEEKTGKGMCQSDFSFQQYISTPLYGMNQGDVMTKVHHCGSRTGHLCLLGEGRQYTFPSIFSYKSTLKSEMFSVLLVNAEMGKVMQFLTPITECVCGGGGGLADVSVRNAQSQ